MDFTNTTNVDTNGATPNGIIKPVLEFPVYDLQSVLIGVDGAATWGFSSIDMAIKPIAANSNFAITHQDFMEDLKKSLKTVRIFVKAVAGTVNVTVAYIGRS